LEGVAKVTDLAHIEALVGPLPKGRALDIYLRHYRELGYADFTSDFAMELADAALAEAYAAIERLAGEWIPVAGACPECGIDPARLEQAEAEVKELRDEAHLSDIAFDVQKKLTEQAEAEVGRLKRMYETYVDNLAARHDAGFEECVFVAPLLEFIDAQADTTEGERDTRGTIVAFRACIARLLDEQELHDLAMDAATERAEQAEAEVERLTWMLDTVLRDCLDKDTPLWRLNIDEYRADLAARHEQEHGADG
jgi:hypothetical protein